MFAWWRVELCGYPFFLSSVLKSLLTLEVESSWATNLKRMLVCGAWDAIIHEKLRWGFNKCFHDYVSCKRCTRILGELYSDKKIVYRTRLQRFSLVQPSNDLCDGTHGPLHIYIYIVTPHRREDLHIYIYIYMQYRGEDLLLCYRNRVIIVRTSW